MYCRQKFGFISQARDGLILENNYVQSTCTPSRNALMTGMKVFKSCLLTDDDFFKPKKDNES